MRLYSAQTLLFPGHSVMTRRCVAGYCSNTNRNGVSLFSFPKDSTIRKNWNHFVKRNRENWVEASKSSVLCSAHFSPECFDAKPSLMASMGLKYKFKYVLKPGAVPTISTMQHPTFWSLGAQNGNQKEDGTPRQTPKTLNSPSQSMVVSTARRAKQTPFGSLASRQPRSSMAKTGRKRVIATVFSEVETNKNGARVANAEDHIDLSCQHSLLIEVPSVACHMVNKLCGQGKQCQMNDRTVLLARRCVIDKRGELRASQPDTDKFLKTMPKLILTGSDTEGKVCTKEKSAKSIGSLSYSNSDKLLESQDFKSDHTDASRSKVYHLKHEWLYSKTKEEETQDDNLFSFDVSLHVDDENNKNVNIDRIIEEEGTFAPEENSRFLQENDVPVCLRKETGVYVKDEEDIFIKEENSDTFSDIFMKEEQDSFVSKKEGIYANAVIFPIDSMYVKEKCLDTASDIDKFLKTMPKLILTDSDTEVKVCTKERSTEGRGSLSYDSSDKMFESHDFKSDHTYAARSKVYHLRHEWLYSKTKEEKTQDNNVFNLDVSLHVDDRNNKELKSGEADFIMEEENAFAPEENIIFLQEDDVCLKNETDLYVKYEKDMFIKEEENCDMFSDIFIGEEQHPFLSEKEGIYENAVMFPIDSEYVKGKCLDTQI